MFRSLRFPLFVTLVLLVASAYGIDAPAAGTMVHQMVIAVPVANDFPSPEIVFSVRNPGAQPIEVNRVVAPGSELMWNGPRGITLKSVSGITHASNAVPIPPGSEVVIDRLAVKTVYLMIASGADGKGGALVDGDISN